MTTSKKFFILTVALLAAFGLGYWKGNSAVPKTVEVEKEVIKRDVKTVVREITRSDGSKETITEIVDKTKEQASRSTTVIPPAKIAAIISATAQSNYKDLRPVYGVLVQRPIMERLVVGAGINTEGTAVVTLGWAF
jgi:hypothetical protein